ncbi:endospore germination permease [Bacillus salitolerans]|uniref:Endospore germination permease n=1 Tax=Bacillus salitolerans TaxID=1437434 RepID=A0ABW4LV28_9BACI
MIQPSDRKLGPRELVTVIILTMGIKFSDMTPTILFKEVGNAAWMVPILAGCIMFIPFIFLLVLLKHYKDQGFLDIIRQVVGEKLAFVFGMMLFLIAFSSTIVNSRSYTDIINTMFFPDTTNINIYILLMVASYFVANRGFLVIGYTAYLTAPYIKAVLALLVILVIPHLNFDYLFPIFGNGVGEIALNSLVYSPIMGDVLFFSIVFPIFKNYTAFKKASIAAYIFVIVELVIFYATFIMYFDYTGIKHIPYPFQEITRSVEVGRFLSNVEALFLGFWSVATVVRFAVYLYISVATFAYSLKIKEFEPLLLPFGALTVLLGSIPQNLIYNTLILRVQYILNASWIFLLILPPLIWTIAKLKGEFSK